MDAATSTGELARPRQRPTTTADTTSANAAAPQQGLSLGSPSARPNPTQGGIQTTKPEAGSWMKRGADARAATEKAKQEAVERAVARAGNPHVPREFYLKPGEAADIIVLDAELGPHVWRHRWWDQEKETSVVELCPKEFESCCLCNQETSVDSRPSDFVAYLTIIDYRQYTSQRTGKVIPYTKKLMIVHLNEIPYFNALTDQLGTLRGAQIYLSRPDKTAPQNGIMEFKTLVTEEVLTQYFNNAEEKDQHGVVFKQAGEDLRPADYESFMERPSNARLISKYNGTPTLGSEQANSAGSDDGWNGFDPRGPRRGGFNATETTARTGQGLGYDDTPSQSFSTSELEAMSRTNTAQGGGINRSAPQMDFAPMDDDIPF